MSNKRIGNNGPAPKDKKPLTPPPRVTESQDAHGYHLIAHVGKPDTINADLLTCCKEAVEFYEALSFALGGTRRTMIG